MLGCFACVERRARRRVLPGYLRDEGTHPFLSRIPFFPEHKPPILKSRSRDGSRAGVGGLIDGKRDQFFLALRLAALQVHIEQGHALPFIADDMFVNFDDTRSQAGFQALGALSRRTQLICRTHHSHLAEVAQQAPGDVVRVLEL